MTSTALTLSISDLVFNDRDEVKTSSLKIAEAFNKQHHHVCQKVESLDCSDEFLTRNFSRVSFEHRGNHYSAWEMTKDGFMFLVMGFTGKKAAAIKEAYINPFNQMANQFRFNLPTLPPFAGNQLPNHTYPNFYDSGWIPAHYQRCQSETHWTYHIKFNVRPRGGKFSATFELGIGGKGQAQPNFSSSGSQFVDSNFYLEYRDLNELWEYIAKVLAKYGARCPFLFDVCHINEK
ncbi:Rha family transcriptional regulator [Vibrio rotiferianus]|uniref:Rha family transcriptional regulator n=1 Tax=Vibrio rotiferianus TaxID=190895 RepID=UPI0033993BAE